MSSRDAQREAQTAEEREEEEREAQEQAEEAQREWDALPPEERSKKAVEQNKKIQEQVREQVKKDEEERVKAQRDAVGAPVSTRGMTFKEAAEATERLNQPPNLGSARERESAAPPASTASQTGAVGTTGTPPPLTEPTTRPRPAKP